MEQQPLIPTDESPKESRRALESIALSIYDLYPRKVARPVALRAIMKAMVKHGPTKLLERTKAYAASRIGQDPQFTPHPATWFNQERFNDDPSTWARGAAPVAKPEQARSLSDLRLILRAKEALAKDLKDHYSREYPLGVKWSDEAKRHEFRTLRQEIKDLNSKIASM